MVTKKKTKKKSAALAATGTTFQALVTCRFSGTICPGIDDSQDYLLTLYQAFADAAEQKENEIERSEDLETQNAALQTAFEAIWLDIKGALQVAGWEYGMISFASRENGSAWANTAPGMIFVFTHTKLPQVPAVYLGLARP